ncbi:MAG: J domain-containing protein [Candidatus Thermoplasmatota archaeon]|nr:J domain-containing protein [Candidatus Thermoplasmatota archaeon]
MYERSARGVKDQLIAVNLWLASAALTFAVVSMADSFFGFILAFAVLLLVLSGIVMFIKGTVALVRGGKETGNRYLAIASVLMMVISPIVVIAGLFSIPPMNYLLMIFGLYMLLFSFVLPYLKLGGWISGAMSILVLTIMMAYLLIIMLTESKSISMPVFLGLFGGYLFFFETSMIISFMRIRKMQAQEELIGGEGRRDIGLEGGQNEVEWPERELRSGRSGKLRFGTPPPPRSSTVTDAGFRVVEYEFSGNSDGPSTSPDMGAFREIPSMETRFTGVPNRTPVTGRALRFEEAVRRMEAAETRRRSREASAEKFTIDEEEEIDLSSEDLFIDGMNMYEVLGMPRDAMSRDIRKAYRKKAVLHHPDKLRDSDRSDAEASAAEMVRINTAKQILLDPARRSLYDRMLDSYA